MSLKKLEKLEKLIKNYLVEIHKLQEEKKQLKKEVIGLKNVIKSNSFEYERVNESLKKMNHLESVNQKIESDKDIIRSKIKGILSDLEQIDFI